MYFWKIEELKSELVDRPFTDNETLPYLLWTLGLYVGASTFPMELVNLWDYVDSATIVVSTLLGTVYAYYRNGGASGRQFLHRFFAIGWVLGVRWVALVLSLSLVLFTTMELLGEVKEETQWYESVFLVLAELGLYWRFGFHIADVAKRAPTT